ncbi:MAG: hypothetical protein JNK74_26370 [Candidatus Hydrogenedentes bacterium]|nr:hypothetical protein [Candidatus Hydrogenedentota bacterium]
MKHIQSVSRIPGRAGEFTTGQKLTLAAGIFDAIAAFFDGKETTGGNDET